MPEPDKRTLILNATLELIAEDGWLGAPMAKVARHAGVSAGIIYHYFNNKQDLIEALYLQIKEQWGNTVISRDVLAMPYPDYLVQLWLNSYHFYATHPREALFIEQYENSPAYQHHWDAIIADNDAMQQLTALLQSGFDAGYLRPFQLPVFYDMTIGVAMSLAKRSIRGEVALNDVMLMRIARAVCQSVSVHPLQDTL